MDKQQWFEQANNWEWKTLNSVHMLIIALCIATEEGLKFIPEVHRKNKARWIVKLKLQRAFASIR